MAQADTIVPPGVQGLDRFAYVGNNPVVYTDPSGHAQYRSDYQNQIHGQKMAQYDPKPKIDWGYWRKGCEDRDVFGKCLVTEIEADITYAITYFRLVIPDGNEIFREIIIIYVGDLIGTDEARSEENAAEGTITIMIGRRAYNGSFGWFGSSINHELCHAKQHLGPTCQIYQGRKSDKSYFMSSESDGSRNYGTNTQGSAMNEVEAYDLELSTAEYFGLTVDEVNKLVARRMEHYQKLFWSNKLRVFNHNYICVQECNWPLNRPLITG